MNEFWMEKMTEGAKGEAPKESEKEEVAVENTDAQVENKQEVAVEQKADEKVEEKTVEQKADEQMQNSTKVVTTLFDMEFETGMEATTEEEPKTAEAFFDKVKKQYGDKDPFEIFGKIEKITELENNLQKAEVEKGNYEQLFSVLPAEVVEIVKTAAEGGDYRGVMKQHAGSLIDFNKAVTSYDKEDLIKVYNPDLTTEDFDEMDEKTKSSMYRLAKENYQMQQKQYTDSKDAFVNSQKQRVEQFVTSADNSLQELSKKFPDIKRTELVNVERALKNGAHFEFYDNTGQYKSNAAELLTFGTHGLKIIEEMKNAFALELKRKTALAASQAKEEIVSEVTTEKIDRGSHQPSGKTTKQAAEAGMPFLKRKM